MKINYQKIKRLGETSKTLKKTFELINTFTEARRIKPGMVILVSQGESSDEEDDCEEDEGYLERFSGPVPKWTKNKENNDNSTSLLEYDFDEEVEYLSEYEERLAGIQ